MGCLTLDDANYEVNSDSFHWETFNALNYNEINLKFNNNSENLLTGDN